MRISVIMSVYNGAEYLVESVQSILNQTYRDFEFIIVNDGSTDQTQTILGQITDPRVKMIHLEKNKGVSYARNLAIKQAKGDWIALQDDDDISLPTRLEEQINYIKDNPGVIKVGTWVESIVGNVPIHPNRLKDEENFLNLNFTWDQIWERRFYSCPICFGTCLFSKQIFQRVGGYDPAYQIGEDYDLFLRMIEYGQVHVIPNRLYQYRIDPYSTSRKNRLDSYKSVQRILIKYITKKFQKRKIMQPRFLFVAPKSTWNNFKTHVYPHSQIKIVKYTNDTNSPRNILHDIKKFMPNAILIASSNHGYLIYQYLLNLGFISNENLFYFDGWAPSQREN